MIHFGFTDGASRHTRNFAFAAWVFHYPFSQLFLSRGAYIGPDSNNVAEYTAMVYLLSEAISLDVDLLVVFLDSQLVVSEFKNTYRVRDPFFLRLFLRVCLLQRSFQFITLIHISRADNWMADLLANQAIDWHIHHSTF